MKVAMYVCAAAFLVSGCATNRVVSEDVVNVVRLPQYDFLLLFDHIGESYNDREFYVNARSRQPGSDLALVRHKYRANCDENLIYEEALVYMVRRPFGGCCDPRQGEPAKKWSDVVENSPQGRIMSVVCLSPTEREEIRSELPFRM